MNALFGSLTTEGLEETQDRIGGFQPFDTDIYTGVVKVAYAGQAQSGARSVTLVVDIDGREYRETVYITDRTGKNYFLNKQDKTKKVPLPGFVVIDDLCMVTTGTPLAEQPSEEKVVNVYDRDAGQEIPKTVPMLTDLIGKTASFGIVRQLENKNQKNSSTGEYEPTAETRETNFIDKVFHTETRMTVVEARNGAETGAFWDSWVERNKGETRDRRTIKDGQGGNTGRPGAARSGPPQPSGNTAPRKALFGNKAAAAA